MAEARRTEVWDASIDKIYQVLTDYENHPKYVDGVSDLEILDETDEVKRIQYSLNLIKKFKYILSINHQKPSKIWWSFESGDLFKVNSGSWELTDQGDGKTEVTYALEVEVKGFAPKKIISTLTEKNLPSMMKTFHDKARE